MARMVAIVGLGVLALSIGTPTGSYAADDSAQDKSCADRATQQGLTGKDRDRFTATCMKGSLAPKHATSPAPQTGAAKALTAPSGSDRKTRSDQCNAEAAKRGLKEAGLQAFRKGCLASAAPVGSIETAKQPEAPAKAKPKLDALTDAPKT